MNKITVNGREYTADKKTLKTQQQKLKAFIFHNKVPALAYYVTIIFSVFSIWVLGYQTIMWSKTNEWPNLPWYQTIVKSEPTTLHYIASIDLWLVSLILTVIVYFVLKNLLPTGHLITEINESKDIVNKLQKALIKNDTEKNT
jgi:hypothetical protein